MIAFTKDKVVESYAKYKKIMLGGTKITTKQIINVSYQISKFCLQNLTWQ